MFMKFIEKFRMADFIKSLAKVQKNKIRLLACNKGSRKVIYQLDELRFAGTALPKTMLEII
ncbi:hypothetical protein DPMN_172321 [Dreissena polymorpha]|uniref:Uncharacterized protein n=1 Tax=Dreissena polymorpha TaxID=45954 RepID=A0A9D4ID80_DREPO|nr:hypothetical protein DPMN_172321 [Dreissena polymorpha]